MPQERKLHQVQLLLQQALCLVRERIQLQRQLRKVQ
jgi:hypothetical protein